MQAWMTRLSDYEAQNSAGRGLGLSCAHTPPKEADEPLVMAVLALANLKAGECFRVCDREYTVVANSGKTLILQTAEGKRIRLDHTRKEFDQFLRDVAGQMLLENHDRQIDRLFRWCSQTPVYPLLEAASRDPVYRYRAEVLDAWRSGLPVAPEILEDAGICPADGSVFFCGRSKAQTGRNPISHLQIPSGGYIGIDTDQAT